eukprot:1089482-Alexandrium_andersonii.AAC.1
MFHCVHCGEKNDTRLVCRACQKPLPVLDEMTELLSMWQSAIIDYRRNVRKGFSLSTLRVMSQAYALKRQT